MHFGGAYISKLITRSSYLIIYVKIQDKELTFSGKIAELSCWIFMNLYINYQIANTCGQFDYIGSPRKANFLCVLSRYYCLLVLRHPVDYNKKLSCTYSIQLDNPQVTSCQPYIVIQRRCTFLCILSPIGFMQQRLILTNYRPWIAFCKHI